MPDVLDHIAMLTATLHEIANGRDCDYADFPADRPDPCTCPVCSAKAALATANDWRFRGAHYERTTSGWNPRETAIVQAWSKLVNDRLLAGVLTERAPDEQHREILQPPTARDWFVATSVVQWLATNVGQEVLRNAGWEYTRYAEDRKALDAKMRATEPLFALTQPGRILSFNKSTWRGVIALDAEHAGEIAFHGSCVEGGCGKLLEDAEVVGRLVFVTRNEDGDLVCVTVPPRVDDPAGEQERVR